MPFSTLWRTPTWLLRPFLDPTDRIRATDHRSACICRVAATYACASIRMHIRTYLWYSLVSTTVQRGYGGSRISCEERVGLALFLGDQTLFATILLLLTLQCRSPSKSQLSYEGVSCCLLRLISCMLHTQLGSYECTFHVGFNENDE